MIAPEHVLFLFLDGVGLGTPTPAGDASANPFTTHYPALEALARGHAWTSDAPAITEPDHVFHGVDATLGVAGLPQSGTGQAALFGGFDAPGMAGRHFGPYPPSSVRPALAELNLFSRFARAGASTEALAFANPFPERFLRFVRSSGRWTASTFCCVSAGVRLRDGDDLRAGTAVPADFTGALWPEIDAPAPVAPAAAGRRLARLARDYRLTLFEVWVTDKAGHSRDRGRAAGVLSDLDAFMAGLLDEFDTSCGLLVLSSDHGNLEDLTTKTHTLNPVPLVAIGADAGRFAGARTIADVVPALLNDKG
jgi:hypothetical protein